MASDYPIIEEGTIIEYLQGNGSPIPDLVRIVSIHADEGGVVQLRIDETAPDTPDRLRSITLQDLHDQLEWREWEDVTDKYEDRELPRL